jgi:hypothetical protein
MRILIATNHLHDIAGAEVVALELATFCKGRGLDIAVFANWAAAPMEQLFADHVGVRIETEPASVRPLEFDLVYFQHQVAGLFSYEPTAADRAGTAVVFGRLSRRSFLESGGWAHDNALGDVTFANSELTAERLAETGVAHPVHVFYNAAPAAFAAPPRPRPDAPQRMLVVSNHWDSALMEAVSVLRQRATVLHVGRFGDEVRLVEPHDLHDADLVISIGKTVQYALRAHVPVYVYDHLGGPGYLNDSNYPAAARYSFSGRCCERTLDGEALAADILGRYHEGRAFAQRAHDEAFQRFALEPHLERLLTTPPTSNADRRRRLQEAAAGIARERLMAQHIRDSYRRERFLRADGSETSRAL